MAQTYSVSLAKIIKEFSLETVFLPDNPNELYVESADLNRPGLQFSGFYEYFDGNRIQIIGRNEMSFLLKFSQEERAEKFEKLMSNRPPAVVITRNIELFDGMEDSARKHGVPLLRTSDTTSSFMSALISFLNIELAPRITRHGVLVEVYGEGILMLGESGVGKSETAIELIKRGHRLIADDAVEIRRVSSKTLELRGIGIVNARRIFGMGSVKLTEKIDMIINLELWDPNKVYDRMGMTSEFTQILGLDITSVTIPVKPGRNLAVIIEVAAMNNRQKKMGYNAAQELLHNLGMDSDAQKLSAEQKADWEAF